MQITLHKNAKTTPAIRKEIQESKLSISQLAAKFGIQKTTVLKWKHRDSVTDFSSCPHNLHKTMSDLEELIVVELRKTFLLPLDDLLAIVHEFINENVSRSALTRCLVRHGVNRLANLIPQEEPSETKKKTFKDYEPGFIHIDVKYLPKLPDQEQRSYLFVAIDRATRWVYLKVCPEKSAEEAATFLEEVKEHAPFTINKILTDNGKEFTDRFTVTGERKPTGNHQVDVVCQNNNIEHRLIKPRYPQTNGMVERFNRRIEELLQQTHLPNSQELIKTLEHYCYLYNHHIPQKNIGHQTPIQTLLDWYFVKPELFRFSPYNLTKPNI